MNKKIKPCIAAGVFFSLGLTAYSISAQPANDGPPPEMSFFITSTGMGDGGNLGGLEGADAHCQALAEAAGAGHLTWRAYLSTQGENAVNARDRIGNGPWFNANGLRMATNLDSLHYDNSNFTWDYVLDENGNQFASRVDGNPDFTQHDALTGSWLDGTAYPQGQDQTCSNWTSNADGEGSARVGHADRNSRGVPGSSWNSSHGTPGCSQENFVAVGGAGFYYCFATD